MIVIIISDKSELSDNIGQQIKKWRKLRNLTQDALGKKVGLGKAGISKIENARQLPALEQLADISKALNVRIEYLLSSDTFVSKESKFVNDFINSLQESLQLKSTLLIMAVYFLVKISFFLVTKII